jgi:hypothetical protein
LSVVTSTVESHNVGAPNVATEAATGWTALHAMEVTIEPGPQPDLMILGRCPP